MRASFGNMDCYLAGHVHKRGATTIPTINVPIKGKLVTEQGYQLFGITGSFLRVYVDGNTNYAEGRVQPSALGALTLKITPENRKIIGW